MLNGRLRERRSVAGRNRFSDPNLDSDVNSQR